MTIKLPIRRRVGFFGSLIVTWQADPVEADVLDFSPASGTVEFADQQATAEIVISILDDAVPEDMEVGKKNVAKSKAYSLNNGFQCYFSV